MLYTFLRDTLRFFGHHWVPLTVITASLGLVFELIVMFTWPLFAADAFPWPAYLLQWLGGVWSTAAVILYLDRALGGQYLAPLTALRQAIAFLLPLAGLQLLVGLGVGIGLFVLLVPGIYLGVKLALSSYYLLLDRQPMFEAMKSAWRGSEGYGWTLLGGYMLIYGVMLLLMQLISGWLVPVDAGYGIVTVIIGVVFKPIGALAQVFGFRVYSDARNSA